MIWAYLRQRIRERWKTWAFWALVGLLMAGAFYFFGYCVPIYGETRLTVSRILIVLTIVCALAFFTAWRAMTWKLRKRLTEDYGARCCAPMPKELSEDSASAEESA